MKAQAKSLRSVAFTALLACLPISSAYARQPAKCNWDKGDAVKQSVCAYRAILAEVDKTYRMRDGRIRLVAQAMTPNYKVEIFQDGRTDHLDYAVRIGAGRKIKTVLPKSPAHAKQSAKCDTDAIAQSACIYQAILADVDKTYRARGGGEISSIQETSAMNYRVRLPQIIERVDILDYTVRIGVDGEVEIVGMKVGVESYGPRLDNKDLWTPIKK
jgi:hypothetical protein